MERPAWAELAVWRPPESEAQPPVEAELAAPAGLEGYFADSAAAWLDRAIGLELEPAAGLPEMVPCWCPVVRSRSVATGWALLG